MYNLSNKQETLDYVLTLEREIQELAQEHSLATLEHKLKQRQDVLEYLFSQYMSEINADDIAILKDIQQTSQNMLEKMQSNKQQKGDEIIKYKNTGKRIRLYTDIAQQK